MNCPSKPGNESPSGVNTQYLLRARSAPVVGEKGSCCVGAGASMVGRSRYCDFPPEALRLPQVGGYVDPSFEAILALRPDLVIGARGPSGSALAEKLEARGIATYFPPTESFGAIDVMILGLGDGPAARSWEFLLLTAVRR